MAQTTIAQMVTSIVGSWTPSDYPELYKDGFNFVADLIPVNSELWHNGNILTSTSLTNTGSTVHKVIRVLRISGSSILQCKQMPYEDYKRGIDTTSIYYHGKSTKNPVWTWDTNGDILISPTGGTNEISYWAYLTSSDFDTGNANDVATNMAGFPEEAHLLAIIKAGINILYTKISDAIQDEEDTELLQLLQVQMQSLQQWFESEASRLHLPHKTLGIEKDDVK
jgi:hypothetical protein